MKKSLSWTLEIKGQTHLVRCEPHKTVYDLYVDDALVLHVPRNQDGLASEQDVRIDGTVCQFVVYDGEPDFAVDGILLGAEAQAQQEARRNKLLLLFGGLFVMVVSTAAAFFWQVFQAAGEGIFGGWIGFACILLADLGGLVMVFWALLKKRP